MTTRWKVRDIPQPDAPAIVGVNYSTLRAWLAKGARSFVGESKPNGQVWFSPHDLAVLRVARELINGGFVVLTATAAAHAHLENVARDTILLAKPGGITPEDVGTYSAGELPDILSGKFGPSIQIIHAGQLVDEISAATRTPHVAI